MSPLQGCIQQILARGQWCEILPLHPTVLIFEAYLLFRFDKTDHAKGQNITSN